MSDTPKASSRNDVIGVAPELRSTPPVQPDAARQAALDKAIAVRRAQAAFKKELKDGKHTDVISTLARAANDPMLQRMKVIVFMESLPGVGKVKAKKLMEEIGIAPIRRLQGLGQVQRQSLVTRIGLLAGMKYE